MICLSILFNIFLLIVIFWTAVAVIFREDIRATMERDPAAIAEGLREVLAARYDPADLIKSKDCWWLAAQYEVQLLSGQDQVIVSTDGAGLARRFQDGSISPSTSAPRQADHRVLGAAIGLDAGQRGLQSGARGDVDDAP